MSFRFSIGKKIGTGFGVLILFIIVVFGATFFAVNNGIETFQKNDQTSNELIQVITPSKEKVSRLRLAIKESKQLATQWVSDQSRNDVTAKQDLKNIIMNGNDGFRLFPDSHFAHILHIMSKFKLPCTHTWFLSLQTVYCTWIL